MKATLVLNPVEPFRLNFRHPRGVDFDLLLAFKTVRNIAVDPTSMRPQFALLPRSHGGTHSYDIETYDTVNGLGHVKVPGPALGDPNGYTIEVYSRAEAVNPHDPSVPTGLIAAGWLATRGRTYRTQGPFAAIPVPVIVGPVGPQGIQGDPGEPGLRGSTWTTGNGEPVVTGFEVLGDMYLDEDTGDVWRWSGSSWMMGSFA
jgi:hypothetical protein